MKFVGLGLGIFLVFAGGRLFFMSPIEYGGNAAAFMTWGIILIGWYWGERNGRVRFNLSKDGHKKLKQVIQEDKTSISEIMEQAFSGYYERRQDSIKK
jgi:hypothetical protein